MTRLLTTDYSRSDHGTTSRQYSGRAGWWVRAAAGGRQGALAERASQGVAYDLRNALFAQIERLSFSYYDRVETGQLLTRVTNDVEQIRTFAGTGIVQLASAAVMLIGSTILLLSLNWRL